MMNINAMAAAMAQIAKLLENSCTKPSEEPINTSHGIAQNYTVWSRLMETFLKGKRKLNFIEGDPPAETDEGYETWGANDAAVRSWIQNSMDPALVSNFASYDTARDLWNAIATRYFDGNDMLRLYELERKVSRIRQAGLTVEQYYSDMDFRQPNPMRCVDDIKQYGDLVENRRVLQFLGGLEDRLDPIRRDLLNAKPFPTVDQAFAAVRREFQRQTTMTDNDFPVGVGMIMKGRPSEHKSSSGLSHGQSTRIKPNGGATVGGNGGNSSATGKPPKCSHCGGKHQRESCFEIIGYPEWWKGKKGRASLVTGGGEQQTATQIPRGGEDGGHHNQIWNEESRPTLLERKVQYETFLTEIVSMFLQRLKIGMAVKLIAQTQTPTMGEQKLAKATTCNRSGV